MMVSQDGDVSIKREAPESPPLKRRLSDEPDIMGEKRQRVDSGPAITQNVAAVVARAIAQQHEEEARYEGEIPHERSPAEKHTPSLFQSDPHLSMRILSLPILDSLSTQILSTLAQGPYSETIRIVTSPDSDNGQAYMTIKKLFDETKKIYSRQAPFLSSNELNIEEPKHRATIRTTNLATFVSSVFGGQDVGFYELNDHFIETFTPEGEALKNVPGELFLNLKTQMYLSAVSQEEQERTKEDILEDLFPLNLEDTLAGRHLESPLSPNEVNFLESSKARREFLMGQPIDIDSIQVLSERHAWEDFLRSLSVYLSQAYKPLVAPYMKRYSLPAPPSPPRRVSQNAICKQSNRHGHGHVLDSVGDVDIDALAEQAAQEALQAYGQDHLQLQNGGAHHISQTTQSQNGTNHLQNGDGPVPFPTQSQPTRVLYERARQAAVAKTSTATARRPGLPSQRRPWSSEEENALMAGLDAVKGPHWSQILALYGPKGTINEILKDRNQVQLKDKARNLKLFFLKSGIEVPYFLQAVTGELKTRAPTQAARKEAEDKARNGVEESRARFDSIMALSQGFRQPQHQGPPTPRQPSVEALSSPEQSQVADSERDEPLLTPSPPRRASTGYDAEQRLAAAPSGHQGGGRAQTVNMI